MTRVYVGPVSAYDLGQVGELGLLEAFDGTAVVTDAVREAVDVEPAASNLAAFSEGRPGSEADDEHRERARAVLGSADAATDDATASVLAGVFADRDPEDRTAVGVVAEDRRLRRLADGFRATVTSSFGVVVRAAVEDRYLKRSHARRIVRRMDQHGLHTTGELRARAVGDLGE
ncbi:MAG: hypothetical protein ABEJ89_06305 [Haloarculaceae archaeon]